MATKRRSDRHDPNKVNKMLRMTKELAARVVRLAKQNGTNVSAEIRAAIDERCERAKVGA